MGSSRFLTFSAVGFFMALSAGFLTANCFAADKSATIDCTDKAVQAKHHKLCTHVVDEMKYRNSAYSVVDCTGELEDGYAVDLCKKVNPATQKTLKKPKS